MAHIASVAYYGTRLLKYTSETVLVFASTKLHPSSSQLVDRASVELVSYSIQGPQHVSDSAQKCLPYVKIQ